MCCLVLINLLEACSYSCWYSKETGEFGSLLPQDIDARLQRPASMLSYAVLPFKYNL